MHDVKVIGAGLAGCEAAWQIANRGIKVKLYEMKPDKKSPAHVSNLFAELVCSNSLRSNRLENAVGLLKEEMRRLKSLIIKAADITQVPAGGALAVDREKFSEFISDKIKNHPNIEVVCDEVKELPSPPAIIATGPLTSDALIDSITNMHGVSGLSFYDAASPIVSKSSLDMEHVFRASRYGRGDDYLNCPMDKDTYYHFVDELINAKTVPVKGFEDSKVFEACMPVESMAKRGVQTLAFGPLKPKGLIDPKTGKMPFAVLQLRQDDAGASLYNLVGFQTRLTFPEQRRVFGIIPALKNAEYLRYGVMHRNTFLNSPSFLNEFYEVIFTPKLYFAGQITGVEGYVESAASGLTVGLYMSKQLKGEERTAFTSNTAIGALGKYISRANSNFQPMNINFGIMDSLDKKIRGKQEKNLAISNRALKTIDYIIKSNYGGIYN
ncbi:MAG TPA: methylenetetrahydrofolate--tRNA-(uracil(54)-C(5))-methyltransferase (FADH(2)-oxidizing) TrmFO [Christensenellaceae bacterium]|nr:methylenetetrahydrofolate--tRNA-(uracil(54)-C(5))-methyltransferase (FADH(2)-oxidizing) TrmFO [Christensenellaceae bacterium]